MIPAKPESGVDPAPEQEMEPGLRATLARLTVEETVALVLMCLLCILVFAQFSLRYLTNYSIPWGEEGARALLVLTVFCGAAAAMHRDSHIAVDLWEARGGAPEWLFRLRHLLCGIFFGYGAWLAWEMAQKVWPSSMASLRISRGWLLIAVAVFMACACVRAIAHVIRGRRTGTAG